jgi:hypothetical protein|tara:strand:- start:19806 stop:20933 length:1128 start_codon:yes stop_codon:yes gene_type:complete
LFLEIENKNFKYIPILAIKPAEMSALEELPEKDKDILLPLFSLKGWAGSKKLKNTPERISKAFGTKNWIADIDQSFIKDKTKSADGEYPREVYHQIEELLDPNDGYSNWFEYLKELPNAIPCLQLGDEKVISEQIQKLTSLDRGLVTKFDFNFIQSEVYIEILKSIASENYEDNLVIFDFEEVTVDTVNSAPLIASVIQEAHLILPDALFAVSGTSFPNGFANQHLGENPIRERQLFQKVINLCEGIRFVYSDKGSAKAEQQNGGGGIPPYPRIDYPLKNDWRFVRHEFDDPYDIQDGEKIELYKKASIELMGMDYWIKNLHLWGTQLIELTAKGDKMGISNPMKATAVRINIHLHQQLHYDVIEVVDTDEDWED